VKFKFGLEKVLNHRKILEDLAQRDYQEALAILNQKKSELEKMILRILDARVEIHQLEVQSGFDMIERVKQIQEFIKLQDIRIERQHASVQESEKLVEARQEILRQKAMDKKILERLKVKKKTDHQSNERRLAQVETDEMVSMRFKKQEGKDKNE
jgi:flagellar FliJ protein